MDIHNIDHVPPFITKDGSEIRELLAHRNSCIRHQTLAEARLPIGASTTLHYHIATEEIYYILVGHGRMQIDQETREVGQIYRKRDEWFVFPSLRCAPLRLLFLTPNE